MHILPTYMVNTPNLMQAQDNDKIINPDKTLRPAFVLASKLDVGVGKLHKHDCCQLIYADLGCMTVATKKGRWVVTPQNGVWVPAGINHRVIRKGPIHLSTLYMQSPIEKHLKTCSVLTITPLLKALLMEASSYSMEEIECDEESRLLRVLKDQIIKLPSSRLSLPMPSDARLKIIAERLVEDPGNRDSLTQWCEIVGASRRTIERKFQKECGLSFLEWRQQMRLLHAIELISMGQPITTVALSVGYNDISFFIGIFKRYLGVTPGRYFDTTN